MNWTKRMIRAVMMMLLAGCASQETLIPQDGPEMKAIYRGALGESTDDNAIYQDEAAALCRKLDVDGSERRCIRKAGQILENRRLALDDNPGGEALSYLPYTRDAVNEIDSLFPRLPNPDLVIYVYPHLATRARAPVPGYSTVIPLYERVQYRLPGDSLEQQ